MTEMTLFQPVSGAMALLLNKGVYSDAPVYAFDGKLYARAKGGYIRLMAQQITSAHNIAWRAVIGVLYAEKHDGLHVLPEPTKGKLKVAK